VQKPFFSIVIPTLNEAKFLPRLLDDLTAQIWPDFEVIVVDAGSDDGTADEAEKFAGRLKLTIIQSKKRGVSIQRNLGGDRARADWVIFMDADNRIDAGFFLTLRLKLAKMEDSKHRFDFFSTLAKLNPRDQKIAKHRVAINTTNMANIAMEHTKSPNILGALIGVRRSWFDQIKFNPAVKFGEDMRFGQDLIAAGAKFKLLRQPRFCYDMRRWDDKNLLESTKIVLGGQVVSHSRRDEFDEYPMDGGEMYQKSDDSHN
jgi:glycosyltransferase involved in cell wall biosynthesis